MNRKRLLAIAVVMISAMTALALDKVTFIPQWTAQAQFAGYFVAKEKGFYAEEGLDVTIEFPSNSISTMTLLKEGQCQFTTSPLLDALCTADKGTDLVNILQTSQQSGLVLVGYNGKNPETLDKGDKVGIWGAGFSLLSNIFNQRNHKGLEFVCFTNNVTLFLSGAIDATLAMSYNELLLLRQSNIDISGKTVYWFSDHDYDIPEDGVYTTRDFYKDHPEECESFAKATQRGWEWCRQHPEEALDIVMQYIADNRILTNRVIQEMMLKEVLRLNTDPTNGHTTYELKKEKVEEASKLLYECQLIKRPITYSDITK